MAGERNLDPSGEDPYAIRAVQRVCDLLDLLQQEADGISLARAAAVTKLPKSSVFRYLATLEARRYVERDAGKGEFRLGLAMLPMEPRQLGVLTLRMRPHLEKLRDEFHETANLGLFDGHSVVYLDTAESDHMMRLAARPTDRDALHATALGKAIAAQMPVDRVKRVLEIAGMPRLTEQTITDPDRFLRALEQIREQGYAVDTGENEVGGQCVAVALPLAGLQLAISISGPAARLTTALVPVAAARLTETAAAVAAEMASAGRPPA